MAPASTSIRDRGGRQKILEGLWAIGIEPGQLNVSADLEPNAFLEALRRNGIGDEFVRRAIAGVDWRAGDDRRPLGMKVADWLRAAGYRQDEVDRFGDELRRAGGTNSPGEINGILTRMFNERTAGAVIHKATGGRPPDGIVWNPFRTDQPPPNVDAKFGAMGTLATNLPPGMTSAEPPTPVVSTPGASRTERMGVPPAPGTTMAGRPPPARPADTGGALPGTTSAGTGAGAGGDTPVPRPVVEKLTPEQRLARLQQTYGWGAAFADIPDVARILNRLGNDEITAEEADRLFRATDWYKQTTKSAREWHAFQKTDPADAARRRQTNLDNIINLARTVGIQNPDMRRLTQLNDLALQFGWSDADVRRALASEVNYDPEGARTGILGQMRELTKQWLVPLSNEAMTSWAQSIVNGTRTMEDFVEYNRSQAKSLFPALGTALDDPEMTVAKYLDPYAEDTAELLGVSRADIDWRDPKYGRAFNQIDPKTNQRTIMSRADWQHTLMNDPMYGFDKTVKGQEMKQNLTQSIMSAFGFTDFA